ncbi:MAG: glutamine--fructose-6-phosphate aminotransferase, partial [Thermoplasmata archaeon]|nr:glutamine--fructose-6-phosphate aminotransferase [Thermoplasmata archaeon]
MCGIVGYIGGQDVVPILMNALRRLEYRGYDSAGVALLNSNAQITVRKRQGRLQNLDDALKGSPLHGTIGIGHTRWATHGEPSEVNSHPHTDCTGNIALVHNGIIENYQELRALLEAGDHRFTSETDTEV